jgi:excinuclease ABC subunit C
MVCFINGKPAKKEYRHYNIKTVTGANDFASMEEVVTRRYKRLLEEEKALPQLIIIDGGKGQLHSACDALKQLGLYGKIAIIGIAKRLEEIYYPEDQLPLFLEKRSPSLKLIQQIRDETHRFAITFHRQKRSSKSLKSEMDQIPGIGPKTFQKLMAHFKTISRIKNSSAEELQTIVGEPKTRIIKDFFEKKGIC